MSSHSLVCPGCGCLCDDIKAEVTSDSLAHIENACAKGAAYLSAAFNEERRAVSSIRGERCTVNEAVDEAQKLITKAKRPLVFGLDSSTCQAQQKAIRLARRRLATIDDASSLSYGPLIETILSGRLPTCALSEVKDNADLLVYWGADAPNTHPRHLSRYTYYAYADYNPAGWYPRVTLASIDIRKTELSAMSKMAINLKPGQDAGFMTSLIGDDSSGTQDVSQFRETVDKSRFCVIFCGMGLMNSLRGDLSPFIRLMDSLRQTTRIAVMPMISESNLRGFTRQLYDDTGYVNQVSFAKGISHGSSFSLHEQLRAKAPDCLVLVDSDPYQLLPHQLMRNLKGTSVIYLGPFKTPVGGLADVIIPTAVPGIEQSGSVLRMDGVSVELSSFREAPVITDEAAISRLMEGS